MADTITWINPEIERPVPGAKIITESAVGMFWGIFTDLGDGHVYIEARQTDSVRWDNIYSWIPYPEEFEN